MAKKVRLTWGGNIQAMRESNEAYRKLKASAVIAKEKREKEAKDRKYLKKHGRPRPKKKVFTSYAEYIASKEWRRKREKAFAKHGRLCSICGSIEKLQVHHKHYKTLYHEGPDDLQILCDDCHANHHEGLRGVVMDSMTREYLSLKF